jgi:hypothetical protein
MQPYAVDFMNARLGIQLRDLHGIPVVGGLRGFNTAATKGAGLRAEVSVTVVIQYSS